MYLGYSCQEKGKQSAKFMENQLGMFENQKFTFVSLFHKEFCRPLRAKDYRKDKTRESFGRKIMEGYHGEGSNR